MKDFSNIKFAGTFRPYQQRVLDSSDKYLKNNKIHIVAAPGSGKTILGLELINRLNSPCIVLSPTNTIRYQWGDRFESMYLPTNCNVNDYISYDLDSVKLITSVTYQAMHSAINKVICDDEDGNKVDYTSIDMFKLINEYGIKTICVDEAHHLQNEWQKALEIFMKGLPKDTKVIALTATPPYDASEVEWNRYIKICGEIDEEIFVTELVKAKNLCPHQDYVYINYPTKQERVYFEEHYQNINKCFPKIISLNIWANITQRFLETLNKDDSKIYANINEYINVFAFLKKLEVIFPEKNIKKILKVDKFPTDLLSYESAINFLLNDSPLLSIYDKQKLLNLLRQFSLTERNKASLATSTKIDKKLINSMGKMESITKIVDCEYSSLKDNLRLLVLTDYIRKKDLSKIDSTQSFDDLSVVSIFENIRRNNPQINLGILSGTLVVLPNAIVEDIKVLLGTKYKKVKLSPLANTGYSEFEFNISNKEKVAIIGKLFEDGKITAIVGTKALLGEGWDSPCINSLIMASFVGSFMLSNQMRGRAIRTYKNNPDKTANIWHLVTLEPKDLIDPTLKIDCNEETSTDYKTLVRRFGCFVGPHYSKDSIESGIDRISLLKKSYTQESVDNINTKMEILAKDRKNLNNKWQMKTGQDIMYMQAEIPIDRTPKKLGLINLCLPTSIYAILFCLLTLIIPNIITQLVFQIMSYLIAVLILSFLLFYIIKSIRLISPKMFVSHISKVLQTQLQDLKIISKSKVKIQKNTTKNTIDIIAINDNIKDQKVLLTAIEEFLSPIKNPRYIICKTVAGRKLYTYSYALPSVLSYNKKLAQRLFVSLSLLAPSKLIYVKSESQSKILYQCKENAYINQLSSPITQKQVTLK